MADIFIGKIAPPASLITNGIHDKNGGPTCQMTVHETSSKALQLFERRVGAMEQKGVEGGLMLVSQKFQNPALIKSVRHAFCQVYINIHTYIHSTSIFFCIFLHLNLYTFHLCNAGVFTAILTRYPIRYPFKCSNLHVVSPILGHISKRVVAQWSF